MAETCGGPRSAEKREQRAEKEHKEEERTLKRKGDQSLSP